MPVTPEMHLDGLAKAHLVGQDAVKVVVVQRHHPLEADLPMA